MNKIYLSRVMKIIMFLFIAGFTTVSASSYSQQITLKGENIPFSSVIQVIRKQSGYTVFGTKKVIESTRPVTIDVKNMPLQQFLDKVILGQPITYVIEDKTISLSSSPQAEPKPETLSVSQQESLSGVVRDGDSREPLFGATIKLKGSTLGTTTNAKGYYEVSIPQSGKTQVLVFSYVGMKAQEIEYTGQQTLNMELKADNDPMNEIVVTGIYQRKKESFSGSASTYTAKELKMVGNQSILQSLKTLDPSFAIVDNNTFGSDPNRMPDIEIRGKSSVIGLTQEFGTNPNQPLFILDGFESTIAVISDFSMDRIESITVLKDAAATAIYGSKAANGVIVVETKRPVAGQLRINYNLNSSVNFADLSDYNLMNAAEKLEYERLTSFYGSLDANGNITSEDGEARYFKRMKEVQRGVDTYWANEPLRTSITQRHTLFAEGGDANLRYSASLSYGTTPGVMKGSSRDATNGNIRLLYRKGNISLNNSLSIDYVASNRETVPYSSFVRANPYHRKYNALGGVDRIMESFKYLDISTFSEKEINVYNPLFDMSNNNVNKVSSQGFTNNFEMEWRMLDELRFRTRIGVRQLSDRSEIFRSPFNSFFAGTDVLQQGDYNETNGKQTNYDGDLSLTYGKLFDQKHMVNAVAGFRMDQAGTLSSGYKVQGFVDDEFNNPTFAFGYPEGGKAVYQEAQRRSASLFLNTGYAYDNRFLLDATFRSDGSSVYGSDKRFTSIWSVGLGWNIHNESFIKDTQLSWISLLKLRGSIGNPGNQNFSDYISMRIYRYNNDNRNPFGSSVILGNQGNKGLKWQKTLDRNIGLDLEVLDRRLRVNADYFNKVTDPLLVFIGMPSSTGTTTKVENLGGQSTEGFTLTTDYSIIRNPEFNWRVNLNMRQLKSKYQNIGNSLNNFNQGNRSRNLVRYFDGASPSDLWAVRSLGIDPATGREVFLNKNDQQTFVHNYDDEVIVGNSEPDMEGIVGTSIFYKGFSAAVNLRYRLGGQVFMQTLYEKVENVTIQNITLNQDKRALNDRWRKPGDIAKFKGISQSEVTPISSRFVQDNNILAGESISLGYDTMDKAWLRKVGASSLTVRAYMNDILRLSTVKNERGIDYPFARSVSFSVGLRF